MRSPCYPSLRRYFRTVQELADAGCMSRTRATDCLYGRKDFTQQEKQAIWNAILVRQYQLTNFTVNGDVLTDLDQAFRVPRIHE